MFERMHRHGWLWWVGLVAVLALGGLYFASRTAPTPLSQVDPSTSGGGGANDLRQRLAADLQKHPELIAHPAVLGGTMRFYDTGNVRVLGPRWVLAPFEDGHIGGKALLRYQIRGDGRIAWRLLDSHLE
jgi:hypothetical protein